MQKTLLNSEFRSATKLLKKVLSDEKGISLISKKPVKKRLSLLGKIYPELVTFTDLERNWFFCKLNEHFEIGVCKFFHISDHSGRQYCFPAYKKEDIPEINLKIKKSGIDFSLNILECNCDLLEVQKFCKKVKLFKS